MDGERESLMLNSINNNNEIELSILWPILLCHPHHATERLHPLKYCVIKRMIVCTPCGHDLCTYQVWKSSKPSPQYNGSVIFVMTAMGIVVDPTPKNWNENRVETPKLAYARSARRLRRCIQASVWCLQCVKWNRIEYTHLDSGDQRKWIEFE